MKAKKRYYRLRATFVRDGKTQECNTREVLGEYYLDRAPTREMAEECAREMQAELAEYGLDPTTRYYVEECEK